MWDLRSSGMSCSVHLLLPTFRHLSHIHGLLEYGTDRLSRNVCSYQSMMDYMTKNENSLFSFLQPILSTWRRREITADTTAATPKAFLKIHAEKENLMKFAILRAAHKFAGARGGVVVKALRYYSGGPGIDSRWCHWEIFPWIPTEPCALGSTQPLKMSTRDFSWGKGGRCVRLTTYHPCSAERQENPEP